MSEFKTGDRVYSGAMGTFTMEQMIDGKRMAGVIWDGRNFVDYVPIENVHRVADFAMEAVKAVRKSTPPTPAGDDLARSLDEIAEEIAYDAGAYMPAEERQQTMDDYANRLRTLAAGVRGQRTGEDGE